MFECTFRMKMHLKCFPGKEGSFNIQLTSKVLYLEAWIHGKFRWKYIGTLSTWVQYRVIQLSPLALVDCCYEIGNKRSFLQLLQDC